MPEPVPEFTVEPVAAEAAEEEASDLGSPGFNDLHAPAPEMVPDPVDNSANYPEVSHDVPHDLYQPASTTGLSYPQGVPEDMSTSTDYFQQQHASSSLPYPHQSQQTSNVTYLNPLSAPAQPVSQPVSVPVPEPMPAVLPQPGRPTSSHSRARATLPTGSGQNHTGHPTSENTGHAPASWQSTHATAETIQPYSSSSSMSKTAPVRSIRSRNTVAPSVYEAPQLESLASTAILSQAAMQKAQTSPTARAAPFQTPTQAARAKSIQGQRSQSRPTVSPFQHSSAQPTAIDTPAIYNSSVATDSNSLPGYDQYTRYDAAPTQSTQSGTRVAYEPYSQQTTSSSNSTAYPSYDAYNSRSQAPASSSLANPVTQSTSSSYTKTAAPSSDSWSNTTSSRNDSSYSSNRATGSSTSAYSMLPAPALQQPANVQSYNVRPPSTVSQSSSSRTNTPTSYTPQPRQQQQHSYNSYSSQSHNTSSQQPPQPPQPQHPPEDWYGFGSANNAAASNYGSGSYGQNRPINISGNTYSGINDQESLYEMLRNNPRH